MMLNYIKNGIIMKRSQEQNPIIEKIRETVKRKEIHLNTDCFKSSLRRLEI